MLSSEEVWRYLKIVLIGLTVGITLICVILPFILMWIFSHISISFV